MTPRKSKAASSRSTSRKSASKSVRGLAMAAVMNGQLDEYVAAKDVLSERLLQVNPTEAFAAMSALASPAPQDNLVGVGIGEKVVGGKYTGAMSVKLLVRIK